MCSSFSSTPTFAYSFVRSFVHSSMHRLILLIEAAAVASAITGVGADLLVILLEGGQILTGLGELSLLHTFADVPVDEGALGVHEVELVVDAGQGLGDGGGVGDHANGALDVRQVSARDLLRWLVVDSALESGWAPVDELDGALGLDGGNGGVDVLWHDVSAVHEAARHVLSVARVALGHHVGRLEDGVGDLRHGERFVERLLGGDHWSVRGQHEVDARVWHQVGLELGNIDVEGTVESEGGGQGRDDLGDQAVQVGVGGALNVEVAAADVVQGLVVQAEGAVGVLEEGVRGQHAVVRLDHGGGDLRGRRDGEGELGLAAVVHAEALQEEGAETGSSSSSGGVVDEEALEAGAVVSELADAVQDEVHDLLADGVVAAGVVVGGILLSGDDLLGMVQLGVLAGADFVAHGRLQVDVDGARHVLSGLRLGEEGVEGVVGDANALVARHGAIHVNAVLEAVQLPAVVSGLDAGLSEVDGDTLTHVAKEGLGLEAKKGSKEGREGVTLATRDRPN
mmetsp:Transcript_19726/g.55730  ORF Transcript_19726/g.55730 Transcript_19726/m.55730 type:complete len:511 (-) Transcript_19726:7-1539(-)